MKKGETIMAANTENPKSGLTRREFFGTAAAAAAAGVMIVPRRVLGGPGYKAPSDTLNIGCVAVGGRGFADTRSASVENVVALCDVDNGKMAGFLKSEKHTPEQKAIFAKAAKYQDWRRMFDAEKGLDAVTISTPDHNHAIIAMAALKRGKHVFCQKPLTHTIKEGRLLAEEARTRNLTTQMGNQGHAMEGIRIIREWIQDGAIGDVTEVHVWTNRPIWPQGIERPKETPAVPEGLDWDIWLGPAPWRPYHPVYCPADWKGWWDFGVGALGDMGAHLIDQPVWALDLGYPETIQASSTGFNNETYPLAEIITYRFAARGSKPPVTMIWYDGGLMPPRPAAAYLEDGRMLGDEDGGCLFVGSKGMLVCSTYGGSPRLLPEKLMQEYKRPPKTIPRSPGIMEEWFASIKAGKKSSTDFGDYGSRLTEVMLLGIVALRFKDAKVALQWDPVKLEFPNLPEANPFVHRTYRTGWSL
jgi:predicted dehydrogenase